jgi:hypothetical protein
MSDLARHYVRLALTVIKGFNGNPYDLMRWWEDEAEHRLEYEVDPFEEHLLSSARDQRFEELQRQRAA